MHCICTGNLLLTSGPQNRCTGSVATGTALNKPLHPRPAAHATTARLRPPSRRHSQPISTLTDCHPSTHLSYHQLVHRCAPLCPSQQLPPLNTPITHQLPSLNSPLLASAGLQPRTPPRPPPALQQRCHATLPCHRLGGPQLMGHLAAARRRPARAAQRSAAQHGHNTAQHACGRPQGLKLPCAACLQVA